MTDMEVKITKREEEAELSSRVFERLFRLNSFTEKFAQLTKKAKTTFVLITDVASTVLSTLLWVILRPFQVTADLVKFLFYCCEFVYKVIVNYRLLTLSVFQWFKDHFEKLILEQIFRFNKSLKHKRNLVRQSVEHRLAEVKIYARGTFKISQRALLLISQRTPGGAWTVSVVLIVLVIWSVVKLITCAKTIASILNILVNVFLFFIQPAVGTCHEFANVALVIFQLTFKIIHYVLGILGSILGLIYTFLVNVLCWHLQVLQKISQLEVIQFIWRNIKLATAKSFQVILATFLPFILEAFLTVTTLLMEGSLKAFYIIQVLYDKFFVVVVEESKDKGLITPFTVTIWILLLTALVFAYRTRNRFPDITNLEVEDEIASRHEGTASETESTWRKNLKNNYSFKNQSVLNRRYSCPEKDMHVAHETKNKCRTNTPQGQHIHSDALKHKICMEFILDKCKKVGPECDHHHCHKPYHWQYRQSNRVWSDFGSPNNESLERLYCDVSKDLFVTTEIDVTSLNLPIRKYKQAPSTIKVDFEEMKLRVDYERIEIRRLSTESYTRCPGCSLATTWVWYWLDESGTWQQYGDKETGFNGPKQDEIEAAYFRHDTSYDFSTTEYSFRIYFSMKPMYQRNTDPKRYTRRQVRRRPKLRTDEDIRALREKTRPQSFLKRWFSFGSN